MKKISIYTIIQILLNISSLNAIFKITYPLQLKRKFPNGGIIDFTIGQFGKVNYGQSLIGELVLADPIEACGPLSHPKNVFSPFLLIKRGNCTFVSKTRYAQLIKVKLAIIVDNVNEIGPISMVDNGISEDLSIPSIFITKKQGDILIDYIKNGNENGLATMIISFPLLKGNKSNVEFWLSPIGNSSYKLINDFYPLYKKLKKDIIFVPHYNIETCFNCKRKNFKQEIVPINCYSQGKYCSNDPDGEGEETGRDVLDQILFEICLYQINEDLWWQFMANYYKFVFFLEYNIIISKKSLFFFSMLIKLKKINIIHFYI